MRISLIEYLKIISCINGTGTFTFLYFLREIYKWKKKLTHLANVSVPSIYIIIHKGLLLHILSLEHKFPFYHLMHPVTIWQRILAFLYVCHTNRLDFSKHFSRIYVLEAH